jgi:myo-inositol-1-phosphate synthase
VQTDASRSSKLQDIRPAKPGDALLRDRILDYDLVRQLREEMNKVKVFRGVYDPRFIGSSQHETATHVLTAEEAPSDSEALKCLRADIRYFKWRNGVVGHTTVIWSASVEPNCELITKLATANELLDAIEMTEEQRGGPLPPSLLYATAALLEGCSFINGGSQNTLSCPGLNDLAKQQTGVYCLGTDFKAGQTKFKTAAVEYIRTMGLLPKVIASSNHLGNNDMRNLATSKATSTAKLRVKHDIFAPWKEDQLDHKVSIMFTEFINDEKRDFVEYTSLGFLGQAHTMVTYTRASDSVLCVPLMIDGAIWCDYFSALSWPYEKVAKAMAYLFKVPEGAAKGVDPGFFQQMKELDTQIMAAHETKAGLKRESSTRKRVRIRAEEKATEWAIPHDARIICAGLACVDMQLNQASGGDGGEGIESFEGEKSIGGGSVSMACKTLARLCHGAPLDEQYMQVTPPVVHSVVPLCKVGNDDTGDKLISLLQECGAACRNVETKYISAARQDDQNARTALAVLPIYKDGRRGCFFDAASNVTFSARELVAMIGGLSSGSSGPMLDTSHMSADDIENYHADLEQMTPIYGAFLFGYPHLLPNMQGEALAQILLEARSSMIEGGIIALDMNGVPEATFAKDGLLRSVSDLKKDPVIGPALEHVDILHMNEDELCLLTGCEIKGTVDSQIQDDMAIASAVNLFLSCGVAVVAVTRGRKGSFVSCNDVDRFRRTSTLPASWVGCTAKVGCVQLPKDTVLNVNGAGDAFTAGFLVAAMLRHTGMTVPSSTKSGDQQRSRFDDSIEKERQASKSPKSRQKKKLTPYTLYMRENYVTLKTQLNDDKKAIFSKCHEMWENESEEVKALYERKALEENDEGFDENEMSKSVLDAIETLDSTPKVDTSRTSIGSIASPRSMYMTNRSLTLESAVQFASLVAAYHIDVSTRDRAHIDLSRLVERAMVVSTKLEEI